MVGFGEGGDLSDHLSELNSVIIELRNFVICVRV
jgi:hypothetical protein